MTTKTHTPKPNPAANQETEVAVDGATCSSSASVMPLDAALEFADSGTSTGGIMTHEALKTLADAARRSDSRERLARLLTRFQRFASVRREVADRWSKKGTPRVAEETRNYAEVYDRCAAELERTINGEVPADPGCDWPYSDSDGYDHDCVRCDCMADIDCDTKYPGERGTCCVCVEHGCEEARAERAKHPISETNAKRIRATD